jgi:hypothetical protein
VPPTVAPPLTSRPSIRPPRMPPALADQPSRGDEKFPTVAVVATCSTASRVLLSNTICVEKPLTEPVTCQVDGSLPSHCAGNPVGPTGGDSPQARAVWARAITIAAATIPIAITVRILAREPTRLSGHRTGSARPSKPPPDNGMRPASQPV